MITTIAKLAGQEKALLHHLFRSLGLRAPGAGWGRGLLGAALLALGLAAAPGAAAQTPQLHISEGPSESAALEEGGSASYTISSDVAVSADLPVNLTCTENFGNVGDTAVGANRGCQATIPMGSASVTFTIQLRDDDVFHDNNRMFVQINAPGNGSYTLGGGTDRWFNGMILDNDMGVSLIAGSSGYLVEGEGAKALFEVRVTHARSQDLTVKLHACSGSGGYAVNRVDKGEDLPCDADIVVPAGQSKVTLAYRASENTGFSVNGGTVVFALASDPAYAVDTGNNSVTATIYDKWSSPPVRLDITYKRPIPDPDDPNRIISTNARHIPPGAKSLAVYRVRNIGTEPIATVWIHHNVGNGNYPNPVLTFAHSEPQIPPTSDGHTVVQRRRGEGFCGRITGDEDAPLSDVFVHESQAAAIATNRGLGNQGVLWVKLDVDPPLPPNNHCRINVDITPPAGTPPDTYYGSATVHFPGALPVVSYTNVSVLGDVSASGGQTDSPVIQLFDAEVVEGNGGERTMVFNAAVFDSDGNAAVSSKDVAFCVDLNDAATTADTADFTPIGRPGCQGGYKVVQGVHKHRILFGETKVKGDAIAETDETIVYEISIRDAGAAVFEGGGTTTTVTGTIRDDDEKPEVSVRYEGADTVEEGAALEFRFTSGSARQGPLSVAVTVTETGNTLLSIPTSVEFPDGQDEVILTLRTENDDDYEADSVITVSLPAPVGEAPAYRVAAASAASATVTNEDEPEKPVVGISATSRTVAEGQPAAFVLTVAPTAHTATLTLTVTVTQEGQFTTDLGERAVTIPANAARYTLTIATEDDLIDEADGEVTVTLASLEPSHVVDMNMASAAVVVMDNDPALTVTVPAVAEGEALVWTLSLPAPVNAGRGFALNWSVEAADGVLVGDTSGILTFAPRDQERRITVMTMNNSEKGAAAAVTLTLAPASDGANVQLPAPADIPQGMVTDNDTPRLSIAGGGDIEEGQHARFTITLDYEDPDAGKPALTVALRLAETPSGRHASGAFPTAITVAAGASSFILSIATTDDEEHKGESRLEATLVDQSEPGAYTLKAGASSAIIAIKDNDGISPDDLRAINEAILPWVAHSIADETASAIGNRMEAAFKGGGMSSAGAGRFLTTLARQQQGAARETDLHIAGLHLGLEDLRFVRTLASGPEGAEQRGISIWGHGYVRQLDVEHDQAPFDGSVTGALVGVDAWVSDVLLGVGLNLAQSDMDWSHSKGETTFQGTHETSIASIHPYAGWQGDQGGRLWGSIGYGWGDAEISQARAGTVRERDLSLFTLALGGYAPVAELSPGNGWRFGLVGEAGLAKIDEDGADALSLQAGWVKAGLELGYEKLLGGSRPLDLRIGLGFRQEYGDRAVGVGLELDTALGFSLPAAGLRFDVSGRTLLLHNNEVTDWGLSGSVMWSLAGRAGQGLSITFRPEWGQTASLQDSLWQADFATLERAARFDRAARYTLELKYDLPLQQGRDLLTLYARNALQRDANRPSLGADFKLGRHLHAGYEASQGSATPVEHNAYLRYHRPL